jgi:hypothetical protein
MSDPIIPRDVIKRQARRAADIGLFASDNPYTSHTIFAKRWLGAFLARKSELNFACAAQQQTTSHQSHCAPRARKAI